MSRPERRASKANAIKLDQQDKMRRGVLLGHVEPAWARRRYIDEAADIDVLAREMGCSVIYARRYLQAHGIFRDRGFIFREGGKPKPGKGVRVVGSRRHPDTHARKGSSEHREKQAAAKRGKTGAAANNWKGGTYLSGGAGYSMITIDGTKLYEHRHVAEGVLGRKLTKKEQVHHRDMDRLNNAPNNLIVLTAQIHTALHQAMNIEPTLDQIAWLVARQLPFIEVHLAQDHIEEAA